MNQPLRILAVFPHPDDTAFFAAGTLARWVAEGHHVTSVCVTSGNLGTMRPDQSPEDVAKVREAEQRAANAVLGVQETVTLGLPDGGFMEPGALRKQLVGVVRKYRPDRLMTLDPWVPYEIHPDHEMVGRQAAEAAAFAAFPLLHPEQLTGDVRPHSPSEVWFQGLLGRRPNTYVDIASTLETKVASALEFESTLAILASMFDLEIDRSNMTADDHRALARCADTWLRQTAQRIGRAVDLAAAEVFWVETCLPGHFDSMDRMIGEMIGEDPAPPRVM